jgi:hypothetical protein
MQSQNKQNVNNVQYKICMQRLPKTKLRENTMYNKISRNNLKNEAQGEFKGKMHEGLGGLSGSRSLRLDASCNSQAERLVHMSCGQWRLKGGHQARVYSDQMILVIGREAGPHGQCPKHST